MMFLMYMAGFAAYILLAALIGWFIGALFTQRRWLKGFATFLFILLIPVGDFIASRVYFQHLCHTQGGLKVFERAEGVEGYVIYEEVRSSDLTDDLLRSPYHWLESEADGQMTRFTRGSDGSVTKELVPIAKSRYAKKRIQDSDYPFNIGRDYYEIIEIATGRVIARDTKYGARWTTFRPWLAQGACPYILGSGPKDIVLETLIPTNK